MQTTEDSDSSLQKIKNFVGFKRAILVAIFLITGVCFASITPTVENIENTNRGEESDYTVAVPVISPLFVSNNTYYNIDNNVESGYNRYVSVNGDISEVIYNVIECESGWNKDAVGDNGKAYGIAQFHLGTFNMFKKEAGMNDLVYTNPEDQLILMKWAFEHGYQSHWSCWRSLYN